MTGLGNVRQQMWLWPAGASMVLLVLIFTLSEELKLGIITANLTAASFLALVGIGQMFPIASGEGGVDLSVPFVMNFSAFLAVRLISDNPASIVVAIAVAIAFGMLVGLVNGTVIVFLRVPPIIGTLAVGYVVLTFVQLISAGGATMIANRGVTQVIRGSFLGIPTPSFVVVLIGVAVAIVIRCTPYGRALLAIGQSRRAARLAGIEVNRTLFSAYIVSGALAGLTGVLLATSVGSADLEIGNPFLLTSVGAVVLGGNRIAGGTASVLGTVFGALLLSLLVVAVTVAGFPIEAKNIASGLIITVVLVAANAPEIQLRNRSNSNHFRDRTNLAAGGGRAL
jgi:ribose transport system permease protein